MINSPPDTSEPALAAVCDDAQIGGTLRFSSGREGTVGVEIARAEKETSSMRESNPIAEYSAHLDDADVSGDVVSCVHISDPFHDVERPDRERPRFEREEAGIKQPARSADPVGEVYTMEALVPGGGVRCHVSLKRELPAGAKLFITPQPDFTAECAPYLKDGETPANRIQREIDENAALLGLLAEERAKAELMRKALESIGSFRPKPASEDVAGWEEWNRAGEYAAGIATSALTAVRGAS